MFASLANLKQHVLFDGLDAATDWDPQLAAIGESVAGQFERWTNRDLRRVVGKSYRRAGGIDLLILPALPIESLGALAINGKEISHSNIRYFDATSGVVQFESYLGTPRDQVTLAHTGGFWIDADDQPENRPVGAAPVPADLLHAWHLQCQATIEFTNLLYSGAARPEGQVGSVLPGLTEAVVYLLKPYRRNS